MANYINSVLFDDETILREGKYTWLDNPFMILLIPVLGLGLLLLYFEDATREIAVTSKRVIGKTGWISRNTTDYPLNKIENIEVNQGIIGRILSYGDVIITGSGGTSIILKGLKHPEAFKQAINQARY